MAYKYKLYGAILGDLAGQPYEFPVMQGPYDNVDLHNPKSHITDDTVMTLASAKAILDGTNISIQYKAMGAKYPGAGYGKGFREWLKQDYNPRFYNLGNSWGNGCLMRASPFMYLPKEDRLPRLIESVICSHNHQISIESVLKLEKVYRKGIQDVYSDPEPFTQFEVRADKTLDFCLNLVNTGYDTHKVIIEAVACGGDTDTNASIAGELTNYFYKDITDEDAAYVESKLDPYLLKILKDFNEKY